MRHGFALETVLANAGDRVRGHDDPGRQPAYDIAHHRNRAGDAEGAVDRNFLVKTACRLGLLNCKVIR
jgi:hypothetical protein